VTLVEAGGRIDGPLDRSSCQTIGDDLGLFEFGGGLLKLSTEV